jgi:hypothetical protein
MKYTVQNFIIARFTPQMFASMSYGVYFFFASMMLCSVVFVWFLIPETKGIPLEAMDRLFSSKEFPARKAHKIILAELRAEDQDFRRLSVNNEKENVEQRETTSHDAQYFEKV